ncbi:MAG: DUF262 domain-containing protein [Planctomycetota bacterium]
MKSWNIQRTQFKVSDFINWQKNKELNLSPSFQRRSVWPKGAKSYLMDSIVRGLPIPPIILRDIPPDIQTFQSIREVIDGQQRIRTIISFISPGALHDFDASRDKFTIYKSHNDEFGGKAYADLEAVTKKRILDYQFMVHVFPSETDDRDILEIFARMNATGLKLNNQELRNASYFGEFKTLAFEIAAEHLEFWRTWKLFSESAIARMNEVEFTSELMILSMNGISDNTKTVIDGAYKKYDETFGEKKEVAKRLRFMLDFLNDKVDEQPTYLGSKTFFYPIYAAIYSLSYGLDSTLKPIAPKKVSKQKVKGILEKARKLIEEKAPRKVQIASERRVSQAKSRSVLVKYLLS